MDKKWHVNRRHFLRGMGYSLGLPLLNAMVPGVGHAQTKKPKVFVGVWGNGMPLYRESSKRNNNYAKFFIDAYTEGSPRSFGTQFKANQKVSSHLRQYMTSFGSCRRELANKDAGGHHRSWLSALSAAAVRDHKGYVKQGGGPGYDLMNETFDQRIARHYKLKTYSASIEHCPNHVHSNYNFSNRQIMENLSWFQESPGVVKPLPTYFDPKHLYDRLVNSAGGQGVPNRELQRSLAQKKDVLSAVLDEIKALDKKLGREDKVRMQEYYDTINDLGKRTDEFIAKSNTVQSISCQPPVNNPGKKFELGKYFNGGLFIEKHLLYQDLMVKAFECDMVQVFSMAYSHTGTNMTVPEVIREKRVSSSDTKWHGLSHYNAAGGGGDMRGKLPKDREADQLRMYADYALLTMELFKSFINKLANTNQGDGTNLLDDTLAFLTPDFCTGHNPWFCPVLLAGTAGGRFTKHNGRRFALTGGYRSDGKLDFTTMTRHNDVLYSILRKMGIDDKNYGDGSNKKMIAGF